MSHAEEHFLSVPAHLSLTPRGDAEGRIAEAIRLPVAGQGTIGFAIAQKRAFTVTLRGPGWGAPALRWEIDIAGARLFEYCDGEWQHVPTFPMFGVEQDVPLGLDPEQMCPYWFSFDYHHRRVRYGKGEMRLGCTLLEYKLPDRPSDAATADPYTWLREATHVQVTAAIRGAADVWRDPVVAEIPTRVVPHDTMTMELLAAGDATVPGNLTPTCRQLYDNVAGERFQLGADFPDFAEAIKRSIADPAGWCHTTLQRKATEFGHADELMTYLRITLGQNQGDSPGVPFVMEIWPSGHYSPVHNHGGSEAVIKVLHGQINVDLYRMLSPHHQQPFATAVSGEGEVAWISGRLNQVHKLVNRGAAEPCITIQCYLYAETNAAHWPYFDYVEQAGIAHFDPNSDADYLTFKRLMREEWAHRPPCASAD